MEGWIKIHKKILDRERYSNINVRLVFIHCLLKANYEDKKRQGIIVERGSFITSIGKLAQEIGLTRKQVLLGLEKLEAGQDLVTKRDNRKTQVFIINYCRYQDTENKKVHQKYIKSTSKVHQRDTTKNIRSKEVKNNNIESLEIFIEKWNNAKMGGLLALPKVRKINDSLKKTRATKLKQYTPEEIKDGANNYIMHIVNGKKKSPDNDYFDHRFTLLEFLNRKGGLDKFINLSPK